MIQNCTSKNFGVLVVFSVVAYVACSYKFYDLLKLQESDQQVFDDWLEEIEKTNRKVEETCRKYGKLLSEIKVQSQSFLFNPKYNMLMCRNAKVCGSLHFVNFCLIAGGDLNLVPELSPTVRVCPARLKPVQL